MNHHGRLQSSHGLFCTFVPCHVRRDVCPELTGGWVGGWQCGVVWCGVEWSGAVVGGGGLWPCTCACLRCVTLSLPSLLSPPLSCRRDSWS